MPDQPLLTVRGLTVRYGAVRAVQGIDLDVHEGEFVALLGANGAGKSSTLLAVSRVVPSQGSMSFRGEDLRKLAGHQIVRRGLVQVPEQRAVFPDLTVAENLQLGAWSRRAGADLDADRRSVTEVLPRLGELARRRAGSLSGGEQQMLVLGKALLARPRLLLIDELSLGLAPLVVRDLFEVLWEINRRGVAVLLVEQFASLALRQGHRAYVLQNGRITFAGSADTLRSDPAILESSYLGAVPTGKGAITLP
jgi:branched-chain amino acid transport system ATP-binding protein